MALGAAPSPYCSCEPDIFVRVEIILRLKDGGYELLERGIEVAGDDFEKRRVAGHAAVAEAGEALKELDEAVLIRCVGERGGTDVKQGRPLKYGLRRF